MGNDGVVAKLVARLGFDVDKRSQNKVNENLREMKTRLQGIAALTATVFGTKAIVNFANQTAIAGDQIAKTAAQFAMSGEEFQKFSFAAERTGVNVQQVGAFFRQLTRRAGEAANGNKTYTETFRKLGIDSVKSGGKLKTTSELFLEVADGIKNTQDQGERLRLLQAVGDEMGPAMVNLLQGGREAIEQFGKELDGIGVVSNENLKEFEDYRDAVSDLKRAFFAISAAIASQVTPILRGLIGIFISIKKAIPAKAFEAFGRVLIVLLGIGAAFAAVVLAKMIPALIALVAPFAPIILAVTALALLIEDLWVLFTGGDSVIGRFIDSIFGPGSATEAIRVMKFVIMDMWDSLKGFFSFITRNAGTVFKALINPIGTFNDAVGKGLELLKPFKDKFVKDFKQGVASAKQSLAGAGGDFSQAFASAGQAFGIVPGASSGGSGTTNQNAQVSINVETSSNATPAQIQTAVANGARQGVNKGFLGLRDSQLVGAQ